MGSRGDEEVGGGDREEGFVYELVSCSRTETPITTKYHLTKTTDNLGT